MKIIRLSFLVVFLPCLQLFAQQKADTVFTLLKPGRVFDGRQMHPGWWVLVKGNHIEAAANRHQSLHLHLQK